MHFYRLGIKMGRIGTEFFPVSYLGMGGLILHRFVQFCIFRGCKTRKHDTIASEAKKGVYIAI